MFVVFLFVWLKEKQTLCWKQTGRSIKINKLVRLAGLFSWFNQLVCIAGPSTGWFFETDIFNCFIFQNVKLYERSNYMENSPDRFPFWYLVSQKFHNFLVIIHLWRLLRQVIERIWKKNWKLMIFESRYNFANISATKAPIFMKFET